VIYGGRAQPLIVRVDSPPPLPRAHPLHHLLSFFFQPHLSLHTLPRVRKALYICIPFKQIQKRSSEIDATNAVISCSSALMRRSILIVFCFCFYGVHGFNSSCSCTLPSLSCSHPIVLRSSSIDQIIEYSIVTQSILYHQKK